MSTGLFALLDDVAALVKASAATLDDIPAQVAKTSGKVSGIVIDDAAVTPKYVVGLDPSREVSIIYHIAKKSLINKLLILGPAALALGFFAPWAIQPILMLGGAYLCYEGYEKIHSIFAHHEVEDVEAENVDKITPEELEELRKNSAVRTDFILSAEIMAITYSNVADQPFLNRAIVMAFVGIGITIAVYGFVGLVVKADDFGLYLAKQKGKRAVRKIGRGIVRTMPGFLIVLGYIGTAAMLWVGFEIIAHGIGPIHHFFEVLNESLSFSPVLAWFVKVFVAACCGVILGFVIDRLIKLGLSFKSKPDEATDVSP
jgi:predicted DNA repair protein MutK